MAKCIVVLGMHRSATSLVSKGLAKADVRIGKNIGPKTKSNPHGHWEDKRFLILNQKILNAAGGNWHNPPPRKNILKIKNNNKLMDILITLVKKRQAANKIWGWKDLNENNSI